MPNSFHITTPLTGQQAISFPVHLVENNGESQKNLNAKREHFSNKCKEVFNWLMEGKEITVLWAANNGVSSLPRRMKDLAENGVLFSDRWENGVKVWFMNQDQIQFNKEL